MSVCVGVVYSRAWKILSVSVVVCCGVAAHLQNGKCENSSIALKTSD